MLLGGNAKKRGANFQFSLCSDFKIIILGQLISGNDIIRKSLFSI